MLFLFSLIGSLVAEQSSQLQVERAGNMEADCTSLGQVGSGIGASGSGGPSSPAPLSLGVRRSVSEILSPGFLAMFGDGRLVSCTIWDHCVEELNAQNDGRNPATSVEDLISSFRPILAEVVILHLQFTLKALKESSLGVETALIPSKENVLRNILKTLQESVYEQCVDEPVQSDHEEWHEVQRRRSLRQSVPLRGISRGRNRGRGSGRRGRGRGHGGQDGGDDGGDGEALQEERINGQFFQDVEQIIVNLGDYQTPPKGDQVHSCHRDLSIQERGRLFRERVYFVTGADQIPYDPYHTSGVACFYHGTRLSASSGFSQRGVQPFKLGTEFSPAPAFYVTNEVTAAFEFPLHNHLGENPHDTVVVYQFNLNLEILHGDIPPPNAEKNFKVRWFQSGVDTATWEAFCNHNMYGKQPRHQHQFDIVIGAMCIPNYHTKTVIPRSGDQLQVAFCTKAACKWVGSCVQRMYIENRMPA